MFKGGFGRAELKDVLFEVGALAAVFDEETSIAFIGDFDLVDHGVSFSLEGGDLARELVSGGHGGGQGLGPFGEISRHGCEAGLGQLVLGGEADVLGRKFGMCLRCAFLVVVPGCPSLLEFVSELLVSGLRCQEFLLEEVVGGRLACVGMEGAPYLSDQDLVPCRRLVLVGGGLLGLCLNLK